MAGGAGAGADGGAGGGGGGGDGRGPSGGSSSSSSGGRSLREMDEKRLLDPGLKVRKGLWDYTLKSQQMECLSD